MEEDNNKESAHFGNGSDFNNAMRHGSSSETTDELRKKYRNQRFGHSHEAYEAKYNESDGSSKLHYLNRSDEGVDSQLSDAV